MADSTSLSLYFHIPFCVKRCDYCNFYSRTGVDDHLTQLVLNKLADDCARGIDELKPESISTVFIGGGTPSLVNPSIFGDFLARISAFWGCPKEITVEANPESLNRSFLDVLGQADVTRLSLGAQSYSDPHLEWLGRPAGLDSLLAADNLIEDHWKGDLSRDILVSLPHLNNANDGYVQNIQKAIADDPSHISVYELTIEPNTALSADDERLQSLPNQVEREDEWTVLTAFLDENDYNRYEVSNFARPGHECLHNMRYWTLQPYLGLGPSAASTVWNDQGMAVRIHQAADIALWLRGEGTAIQPLSVAEFALEHFMMGLRTAQGLIHDRFESIFGVNPKDCIPKTTTGLVESGLLIAHNDRISLNSRGLDVLDRVLRDVVLEIDTAEWPKDYSWP